MRGNWNTGDPLAASAKGQQQINVEHRGGDLPLHSPATPAWNIADRIVKQELPEDKNDDSGVSPGHYTSNSVSPRSRRSSSTANGSLSPGSATSQDSSAIMQYEYSPQRIFKSCVSPIGFGHGNGNRSPKLQSAAFPDIDISQGNRNSQNEQPLDMVSSTMKQESDDSDSTMQCPICPFNTVHRMQFNEHLAAHCSPKQCDTTDYTTSAYSQMGSLSEDGARGSPSQGDRSEQEFDETDEPGLRVPRVNCQGKVKTFKCKQCNFTAVTKLAFWEHSRGHIKAEKLLTCPRCPFVTEYKHHLEYHLRNHFNSKPFKCDKCPYSCVNKSMLNSHLKSHSNVYQYRCAECSYATKYCHSLKLHLRKYAHKPAMVLNPDGSPNPLPIIDVYGTRRGPKQKSAPKSTAEEVIVTPSIIMSSPGNTPVSLTKMAPVQSPPSFFSNEHNLLQQQGAQLNVPFPYSQIFNAVSSLPVGGNFFQQFHDNNNHSCNDNRKQLFDVFGFNREVKMNVEDYCSVKKEGKRLSPVSLFGNSATNDFESSNLAQITCVETVPVNKEIDEMKTDVEMSASPLDLSKPEINSQNCKTNSPRAGGGTSRRKGRAFKLDKLIVANDSEDETIGSQIGIQTTNISNISKDFQLNFENNLQENNNKDDICTSGGNSDYNCHYCDIAFGNVVMYTMHMGYHGYKNPYTCNMCGHQCEDKVSFFLHIARDSHS